MSKKETYNASNIVNEDASSYGFAHKSEIERLREDIYRPDKEKLQLFIKMLRRNEMLNKSIRIKHSS